MSQRGRPVQAHTVWAMVTLIRRRTPFDPYRPTTAIVAEVLNVNVLLMKPLSCSEPALVSWETSGRTRSEMRPSLSTAKSVPLIGLSARTYQKMSGVPVTDAAVTRLSSLLKLRDFYDEAELKAVYFAEVEALIKCGAFDSLHGVSKRSAMVAAIEDAMKRGAYHYFTKPFRLDEVLLYVQRAIAERRLREENRALRQAVALDPGYGRALTNLGSALAASGDFTEAVDTVWEALMTLGERHDARAESGPIEPGAEVAEVCLQPGLVQRDVHGQGRV